MSSVTRARLRALASSSRVVFEVNGFAYDATEFAPSHPGGAHLLESYAGRDASDAFEDAAHSAGALAQMEEYKLGPVERPVLLLFGGSPKGVSSSLASQLHAADPDGTRPPVSMAAFDPEDLAAERAVLFVVSTYEGGAPHPDAAYFFTWLREAQSDHRVRAGFLAGTRAAVFAVGNSLYEEHYNGAGRELERLLRGLGAQAVVERGEGDVSVSRAQAGTVESDWAQWSGRCVAALAGGADYGYVGDEDENAGGGVLDLEDLDRALPAEPAQGPAAGGDGVVVQPRRRKQQQQQHQEEEEPEEEEEEEEEAQDDAAKVNPEPREMLQPHVRKNLEKQGYKLIGSHSAVKLCRWTKAMLRGRGGCYKNNSYGIVSYQCMEMTPSMACANKCTFCWRAGTNPVSTGWVYKTDPPELLIEKAVERHVGMIKEMRGVPGVRPDRFREAFTPKHCALSLVGEPIMYPHINEFVRLLHARGISSFLVTNATFPQALRDMEPVTQLYLSVDAPTRDALKAVDRPLFKDFWERLMESLDALRAKRQRTVFRLTLVKEQNMDEVEAYARLVERGRPTFVEVKSVTWNATSELSMGNVPFHHETRRFAERLCALLGDRYEIACEHVHTCFVLIADRALKVNGRWHTWIDYPRFNELVREYYRTGAEFGTADYMAETPAWALYGADEEGFNPSETRVYRGGKQTKAERNARRTAAMVRQGVEPPS